MAYSIERSHADNFMPVSSVEALHHAEFSPRFNGLRLFSTVCSQEVTGRLGVWDVVSILEMVFGVLQRQLHDDLTWLRPRLDDQSTANACIQLSLSDRGSHLVVAVVKGLLRTETLPCGLG